MCLYVGKPSMVVVVMMMLMSQANWNKKRSTSFKTAPFSS